MTFKTKFLLVICFYLFSLNVNAARFFVATNGNDTNSGAISNPFATIQRAQDAVVAGDTVYVRGGTYMMTEAMIAATSSNTWAFVTYLTKSGSAGKTIKYWAYPGEQPIFNYQNVKPANLRVHAFQVTGSYIHIKGLEVVGVQVTILTHTQSECFENQGSNNLYEQLKMHDGQAIGFYLTKGSNNLILNCDAYNNWDYTSENKLGGNTDGFGNHPSSETYVNNVFRGCRAWFNSDDGYDCISAKAPTVFENCWAFYNGYSSSFASLGDGNGFKAGGYGSTTPDRLPTIIPRNTVQFCLSVKNKSNGFYSNHHLAGSNWYQNTAYLNGTNYNMLNRKGPSLADYLTDVAGYDHVLKNNLGFSPRSTEISQIDYATCNASNNHFNLPVSITTADFQSLDLALLIQPRLADGSLPNINFMNLVSGSDLIDKGIDIGFPYQGAKPDLGYKEFISNLPISLISFKAKKDNGNVSLKWETESEQNNLQFIIERSANGTTFDSIGVVKGAGSSSKNINYLFIDKSPFNRANYYRLKQVDFDGKFSYSNVSFVDNHPNFDAGKLIIYPNPANEELHIKAPFTEKLAVNFSIVGLDGKTVIHEQVNSDGNFKQNIVDLSNGLYFVEIRKVDTKEMMYKGKFVKAL